MKTDASLHQRCTSTRYRLILKITMCHELTVDHVHAIFGVGCRSTWKVNNGRSSRSYTWLCNLRDAVIVLRKIVPFSVTKQEEIAVALEFADLPLSPRGGKKGSTSVPADLQAKREDCFVRMRALKSRSKFRHLSKKAGRKACVRTVDAGGIRGK